MPRQYLTKRQDIPVGQGRTFLVGAKKIILCNVGGTLRAYVSYCPHQGGSIRYDGRKLQCNWHGAEFDAATGATQTGPASEGTALEGVELTFEGEAVYAEIKEKARSAWADDF